MGEDRGDRAEDSEPVRKMTTARTDQKSRKSEKQRGVLPATKAAQRAGHLGCPSAKRMSRKSEVETGHCAKPCPARNPLMLLMWDTQNVPVSRRRPQRGEGGTRGTGCYRHPSRVPTSMSRLSRQG